MRRSAILRLTSVFGLVLVLAGCGSTGEPPGDATAPSATTSPSATTAATTATPSLTTPSLIPSSGKAMRVTMTGTVEEGVESGCLVFTDEATGAVYSVAAGQVTGTALESRVTITGTVDPEMMSICQQGEILLVESVEEPTD